MGQFADALHHVRLTGIDDVICAEPGRQFRLEWILRHAGHAAGRLYRLERGHVHQADRPGPDHDDQLFVPRRVVEHRAQTHGERFDQRRLVVVQHIRQRRQAVSGRDEILAPAAARIGTNPDQQAGPQRALGNMFADTRIAVAALLTEFPKPALAAAEGRVDGHPLADAQPAHALADRGDFSEQFVSGGHRQRKIRFGRRHGFPLQKAEVAAADPGDAALDHDPAFVRQIRGRDVAQAKVRQAG